jgi:phage N-6-adenine-methyltransferase
MVEINDRIAFDLVKLWENHEAVIHTAETEDRWYYWRDMLGAYLGRKPAERNLIGEQWQQIEALTEEVTKLRARLKRSKYGMYGRGDQEKETPPWLYDHFDREFHFTCDGAASQTNYKHPNYFDKQRDGLAQEWHGVIWLNPPYNDIERWLRKAWKSAQNGCTVAVLVPVWTKMNWFQTIAIHVHIRLLSRRPSFVGHRGEPSFDFMLLVFTKASQYRDGRLHVSIEHIDDPAKTRTRKKRSAQDC